MKPRNRKLFIFFTALFLAFTLGFGIVNAADKLPDAGEIWKKVMAVNPGLNDYSVDIKVRSRVSYGILNPSISLEGTYFFKKPDYHKLQLKKASQLLDKYPKIFGWSLPDISKCNTRVKSGMIGDKQYYIVQLTPKVITSDLIDEELWVDPETYVFPRHTYIYKEGGRIDINVTYRKEKGYILYDTLNAQFKFPKINLSATADTIYKEYKLNPGLSDDFFKVDK